jgi:hypothetical protein
MHVTSRLAAGNQLRIIWQILGFFQVVPSQLLGEWEKFGLEDDPSPKCEVNPA